MAFRYGLSLETFIRSRPLSADFEMREVYHSTLAICERFRSHCLSIHSLLMAFWLVARKKKVYGEGFAQVDGVAVVRCCPWQDVASRLRRRLASGDAEVVRNGDAEVSSASSMRFVRQTRRFGTLSYHRRSRLESCHEALDPQQNDNVAGSVAAVARPAA